MITVSLQDLQRDPAGLLDRVEAGECLVVARDGRPVAELRPLAPLAPPANRLAAGSFALPADIDAPLPDDTLGTEPGRSPREIIAEFRDYSRKQGRSLSGLSVRDLIEEGRK